MGAESSRNDGLLRGSTPRESWWGMSGSPAANSMMIAPRSYQGPTFDGIRKMSILLLKIVQQKTR